MSRTDLFNAAVLVACACTTAASADFAGNYSNDFSADSGNHHGQSQWTDFDGNGDLWLVKDGQGGHGTWETGGAGFTGKSITRFSASFDFSFNTNNNGGLGDGFSFLFGDMSNMGGDRWVGGEGGLNAFTQNGQGMSIGFDTYGGDSVKARWGGQMISESIAFGTEWWDYAREESAGAALDDANQGNIIVNWDINLGLQVLIDWGDDPIDGYFEAISTNFFTWPDGYDMTNWSFGFAGRNGGIDNDIFIDNLNIDYEYIPAPGAFALLGLAGLAARRRRG